MDPNNHTLINLVTHDNPHAPSPLPTTYSLARSVGLSRLIQQRNAQQIQDLSKSTDEGCILFDVDPSNKRHRMERKAVEKNNEDEPGMVLAVDGGSISVLRPVHPKHNLWVCSSPGDIACLMNYLRSEGFDEGLHTSTRNELPSGITKRGKAFYVRYKKDGVDGIVIGWKSCPSLEAAVAFQDGLSYAQSSAEEEAAAEAVMVFAGDEQADGAADDACADGSAPL